MKMQNSLIKAEYPKDLLSHGMEEIVYDGKKVGVFKQYRKRDILFLHFRFVANLDEKVMRHLFWKFQEKYIRLYKPSLISIASNDERVIRILKGNRYIQSGHRFHKSIDPLRYQLDDSCFDEEGFLIHQGIMEQIPFGWFNTRDKGCGWIAAYNLLRLNLKEELMGEVAKKLSKKALLGGVFGESYAILITWLRYHGLKVLPSLPGNRGASFAMRHSDSGILLYTHRHGAHYTTYENNHDGTYHFYNAIYGKNNHIEKAEDFLRRNSFLPLTLVITVKDRK